MQVRKIRLLRQSFGISLRELGDLAGVSKQRMSEVELGEYSPREPLAEKISEAFTTIVAEKLTAFSVLGEEFNKHKDSLFELVEDNYEL